MSDASEPITGTEDVIDSRDVIARIEYLTASFMEATGDDPDDYAMSGDDWRAGLSDDEADELVALLELAEQGESAPDWQYGEVLIHDDYFEDYARELAEDIGAINRDAAWPANCIDWGQAARELRVDYWSVEFKGETYWIR